MSRQELAGDRSASVASPVLRPKKLELLMLPAPQIHLAFYDW